MRTSTAYFLPFGKAHRQRAGEGGRRSIGERVVGRAQRRGSMRACGGGDANHYLFVAQTNSGMWCKPIVVHESTNSGRW